MDLITAAKHALKMLQNDRDAFVVRAMRANGTLTENDIRKRNRYDEVLNDLQKEIEAAEAPVGWCVFDNSNIPCTSVRGKVRATNTLTKRSRNTTT